MSEIYAESTDEIAREIGKLLRIGQELGGYRRPDGAAGDGAAEDNVDLRRNGAVSAYDNALRETILYMESVKRDRAQVDPEREFQLSRLWSEASMAIANFDPRLANRCFIKGQGWLTPIVWDDARYKGYKVGIDDMRQARIKFTEEQFAPRVVVPSWFNIAGVGFAVATFLSLMYFLTGPELSSQKRIIFDAWIAFCVAASAAFLGGSAAAHGTLPIPGLKDAPLRFSAIGGIATFVVVFVLFATLNR